MRIGQGFDVHAFGPGNHVVLGGVTITHSHGLVAHSDGDVVIHALCDAILGALALGDIGRHFPPSDPRWEDVSSRQFLLHCAALMIEHGYLLANADITVICEHPKVSSHAVTMCANLAADLGCLANEINIKATTTERLGFAGREEGIAAMAVVLLVRRSRPVAETPEDPEVRTFVARLDLDVAE